MYYYYYPFNSLKGEQSASNDDTEIVCENGVCFKRPKQNSTQATPTESVTVVDGNTTAEQPPNEEKLARAKEIIEKKRKEKDEESARVSRSRS